MRTILSVSTLGLLILSTVQVLACGGGADGASMCGKATQTQAQMSTPVPNATPVAPAAKAGGCECCKNMAMMKGMEKMEGEKDMPGMVR